MRQIHSMGSAKTRSEKMLILILMTLSVLIYSLLCVTVLVTIFDTLCNLQGPHCKVLSGKSDEMMYSLMKKNQSLKGIAKVVTNIQIF